MNKFIICLGLGKNQLNLVCEDLLDHLENFKLYGWLGRDDDHAFTFCASTYYDAECVTILHFEKCLESEVKN